MCSRIQVVQSSAKPAINSGKRVETDRGSSFKRTRLPRTGVRAPANIRQAFKEFFQMAHLHGPPRNADNYTEVCALLANPDLGCLSRRVRWSGHTFSY